MNETRKQFGDLELSSDIKSASSSGAHFMLNVGEMMLDVVDFPSKVIIQGFLAGVAVQDLSVRVTADGVLHVEAVRRPSDDFEEEDYLISECFYGKLSREVLLPVDLDYDSMHAQLYQGVLRIEIAKLNLKM